MTIVENLPEGQYSHMPELIDVIHNNNMARYGFEALDDTGSPISDEQYMEMVKGVFGIPKGRRISDCTLASFQPWISGR